MGIEDPPSNRAHSGDSGGLDPRLRDLLEHAYRGPIDVDVAADHLWRLDCAARAARAAETADPGQDPERTPGEVEAATRRPPGRVRRALATVAVAALLLPSAGIAVAQANTALPGDVLYQVKLGGERVQLALARTPESDARLHLKFARTRLWEAGQIAPDAGVSIPDLVARAVDNLEAAAAIHSPDVAMEVAAARLEVSHQIQELGARLDDEHRVALEETRARLGVDVAVTPPEDEDPASGPSEPEPEVVPAPEPAAPIEIAEVPEPLPPEEDAVDTDAVDEPVSTDPVEGGGEGTVVATGPGGEATEADLGELDRLPLSGEDASSSEDPVSGDPEPEPEPEPAEGGGQDPGADAPPEAAHTDDGDQPVAFFEGGDFSSDDRRPGGSGDGGEDESTF